MLNGGLCHYSGLYYPSYKTTWKVGSCDICFEYFCANCDAGAFRVLTITFSTGSIDRCKLIRLSALANLLVTTWFTR